MVKKSSKSIENRCTHFALRLVLIGKHAHRKGNIRHVRNRSKAIASNVFPLCSHYAIILFDEYRRPHRLESSLCGYTPLVFRFFKSTPTSCSSFLRIQGFQAVKIIVYNNGVSLLLITYPRESIWYFPKLCFTSFYLFPIS